MQIKYLHIGNYLCLQDFKINLKTVDNAGSSTILIGENGSGKSTFLKFIMNIMMSFEYASVAEMIECDYTIEYRYAQKNICINKKNRSYDVDVDGQWFSGSMRTVKEKLIANNTRLFPQRIISFYSGNNKTFYEAIRRDDIQYTKKCRRIIQDYFKKGRKGEKLKKEDLPKRKYIYCDESFVPIYLCAILAGRDSYEKERLQEQCKLSKIDRIVALLNVEFFDSIVTEFQDYRLKDLEREWKYRESEWQRRKYEMAHHGYDREDNEFVWEYRNYKRAQREYKKRRIEYQMRYFEDVLLSFIEYLDNRLVPIFENCRITPKNSKEILVEIYNIESSGVESNSLLDVFEKIKILYKAEYLVYVYPEDKNKSIKDSNLSEGQRQLIKILGMLGVCKSEDCLVLMDEPDAFMNPNWGYNIKEKIDRILKQSINTQAIITTQNPLLINGVSKDYIRIFEHAKEYTEVRYPDTNTEGMGIDGLLQSEYYEMPSVLDSKTKKKMDEKYDLLVERKEKGELTKAREKRLDDLTEELEDMTFSRNIPTDNYYNDYVAAMHKIYREKTQIKLTKEEIAERNATAKKILQEILEK